MFLTFLLLVSVLSFPRYLDRFSLFWSCTRSNYGCETESGSVLTLLLVKHPFGRQNTKQKTQKKNDDGDGDNNNNQFPTFLQRAMEKLQGDGFRTRGLYRLSCVHEKKNTVFGQFRINGHIAREKVKQPLLRFH